MITEAEAAEIAERYGLTEADMTVVHDLAATYQDADRVGALFALQVDAAGDDADADNFVPRTHPVRQMFADIAMAAVGTVPTSEDLAAYGITDEHLEEVQAQAARIAALRRAGDNEGARNVADEAGSALARKLGEMTEATSSPSDLAAEIPRL